MDHLTKGGGGRESSVFSIVSNMSGRKRIGRLQDRGENLKSGRSSTDVEKKCYRGGPLLHLSDSYHNQNGRNLSLYGKKGHKGQGRSMVNLKERESLSTWGKEA